MSDLSTATGELVLYTCHIDRGGAASHACRRAHEGLEEAGHDYRTEVLARNRPFGIGTKGRWPELKALSGQEKLPVLKLPDGSAVNGSREIVKWARENAPGTA